MLNSICHSLYALLSKIHYVIWSNYDIIYFCFSFIHALFLGFFLSYSHLLGLKFLPRMRHSRYLLSGHLSSSMLTCCSVTLPRNRIHCACLCGIRKEWEFFKLHCRSAHHVWDMDNSVPNAQWQELIESLKIEHLQTKITHCFGVWNNKLGPKKIRLGQNLVYGPAIYEMLEGF